MDKEKYQEFAKERLGGEFKNIDLLITALTHRSFINESKTAHEHNERLEFLGDAILELTTSDYLYRNYNFPEGVMTAVRAALVRTESICEAGKEIGYEPLIRMSKGEVNGPERGHDSIIADCFEAVTGAIYLDHGYEAAKELISKYILSKTKTVLREGSWRDAKSYLQELAQKHDGAMPVYRVLKEEGPDHDKDFTVGVYVLKQLKGVGEGHSKQEAQTKAAREAVKKYLSQAEE